jgi:hypothetical protein
VRFCALTPHYQRYSSTMNQSDYQSGILFTPLCSVRQQLLFEIGLALPGSSINSSFARRGLRPQYVSMLSPLRACLFRLQRYETLGLRTTRNISGLNTFTCVAADILPHSGFMQFVTIPHTEFSTELVVNLYSGWIVQLVNASFAWHTHISLLYSIMDCQFLY